jgi:hypothetical protein
MPPKSKIAKRMRRLLFRAHVLKGFVDYWLLPGNRTSREYLAQVRDRYGDRRCFILGNGPSLRKTNLTLLRDEVTFGLNRIYLLFPELGFTTTYLLSINPLVIEQCASEILAQPTRKFLPWPMRRVLPKPFPEDLIFIQPEAFWPRFGRDARGLLWNGATVTYVAMQLAYHMGFREVILIGVDHSFVTQGRPHQTIVSQGDDPNHFSPDYFGKGFEWQLPDLQTSERAYRLAKQVFEADGRSILDATVGGKLTVFPKVEYESLFR